MAHPINMQIGHAEDRSALSSAETVCVDAGGPLSLHLLTMPKPKRPRSKPDLVDRLCGAIEHLTAVRASRSHGPQWIMVHSVARHLGISEEQAQQAVARAVQQH